MFTKTASYRYPISIDIRYVPWFSSLSPFFRVTLYLQLVFVSNVPPNVFPSRLTRFVTFVLKIPVSNELADGILMPVTVYTRCDNSILLLLCVNGISHTWNTFDRSIVLSVLNRFIVAGNTCLRYVLVCHTGLSLGPDGSRKSIRESIYVDNVIKRKHVFRQNPYHS